MPGPDEPRSPCLSSDLGSEVNDKFPTALARDAAADPKSQSFSRSASRRAMELIRRHTGSLRPGGKGTTAGREKTKLGLPDSAAAAAATIATEAANKVDGQRTAVPPASPRPSNSPSLRRKLDDLLRLGARTSNGTAVLDWKPHEKVSKILGYRPRGHGRPFTDSYTLSEVLGRGGFGVVREGNTSSLARLGVR